jgi:hypothetical protein
MLVTRNHGSRSDGRQPQQLSAKMFAQGLAAPRRLKRTCHGDREKTADPSCEIVCLGSPIGWKWIQQGPKLQFRWMPPIENRLDQVWSEQGESQDAADVGLVDLLDGGKLRN